MKKIFEGRVFNRMEIIGNKEYQHIGCEGERKDFGDFLVQFVPKLGMRRKVKFTIEALEKTKMVEEDKKAK